MNAIKDILQNPGKYRKFYVALATFVVTLLTLAFGPAAWLTALVTFLGTVGVYGTPNQTTPSL